MPRGMARWTQDFLYHLDSAVNVRRARHLMDGAEIQRHFPKELLKDAVAIAHGVNRDIRDQLLGLSPAAARFFAHLVVEPMPSCELRNTVVLAPRTLAKSALEQAKTYGRTPHPRTPVLASFVKQVGEAGAMPLLARAGWSTAIALRSLTTESPEKINGEGVVLDGLIWSIANCQRLPLGGGDHASPIENDYRVQMAVEELGTASGLDFLVSIAALDTPVGATGFETALENWPNMASLADVWREAMLRQCLEVESLLESNDNE